MPEHDERDLTEHGYYFNVSTGEVEQGMVSSWPHRMGPYASRDDAAKALETARQRSEAWDEDDKRWDSWESQD